MKYNYLGYLGIFGVSYDKKINAKFKRANKLVNEHTKKINTFETEEENKKFDKLIRNKIAKIFKEKMRIR